MRISDWSSDVCSSDLTIRRSDEESALQQVLEETDALDVSHPQIYRDDSWRQPFKRLRAEHPVYYCPQSRSGPYWSISRYADIVRVRSEEHTSELQSLMRISYAVFCLKKKRHIAKT